MASKLVGLRRQLTWNDFRGAVPESDERSAETSAEFVHSGLKPKFLPDGSVTIADTLVVTIVMHSNASWSKPDQRTDALKNHEQGHYDIAALMGRDFFLDMMQLKSQRFASTGELQTELTRIKDLYPAQKVSDKYDSFTETDHGNTARSQLIWDGFFRSAFTTPRVPEQFTPGGVPYKVTLRKVLTDAGKMPL